MIRHKAIQELDLDLLFVLGEQIDPQKSTPQWVDRPIRQRLYPDYAVFMLQSD